MRELIEWILGGKFVLFHRSTNDSWYRWQRTRNHWLAVRVARVLDYKAAPQLPGRPRD